MIKTWVVGLVGVGVGVILLSGCANKKTVATPGGNQEITPEMIQQLREQAAAQGAPVPPPAGAGQ